MNKQERRRVLELARRLAREATAALATADPHDKCSREYWLGREAALRLSAERVYGLLPPAERD